MAPGLFAAPMRALADDVTVCAAASLTNALDRLAAAWMAETGHAAVVAHAGSSARARQIRQGAPADILVPASVDGMDIFEATGDLRAGTRGDLPGDGPLAMVSVDAVPAVAEGFPDCLGSGAARQIGAEFGCDARDRWAPTGSAG